MGKLNLKIFFKWQVMFFFLLVTGVAYSQNNSVTNESLNSLNFPIQFEGNYAKKGNDSIKIINKTMRYMLSFIINKLNFENNTFIEYTNHPLKMIIDSLSQKYLKFNYFRVNCYSHDRFIDSGFVVSFFYLIDSNTIYSMDLFFVDTNLVKNRFKISKKQFLSKIIKIQKFGILAFKNNEIIKFWKERIDSNYEIKDLYNDKFYKEYLKLLKRLSKQKIGER